MNNENVQIEKFKYDNKIVSMFAFATVLWAVVGMLVGLIIALQLYMPWFFHSEFTTFGRLRPLHTNAIIFAFVGNGIFMGVYYSLQRLLKARMWSDKLGRLHFWGWQLIIVAAAITLPLGLTSSKEYAELEWPIDIAITIIWVVFGLNMFMTILHRRERHLYVAVWFYIATFVTVAVLHVVNSFELPVAAFKSYSLYAGVQDALVQWWYGHNAVAFFLTTPYLGLMYYFLPKAANRPVYSYKLSIIHFWALIFIYIWAGPHHLLYTSLPGWAQSLGTVFSIMLIAPSWGGMINGLLTLRGAWDKVRESPVLKFMVVAVTAYGMATFEGPLLSLKSVNAISHFTDWTIAHVHVGGLGWNGMLTFGVLYWLIPRIYKTELYSMKLANVHFWIATLGILFWTIPMYWAGFTQSMNWSRFAEDGTLVYGNFLETVLAIKNMYILRSLGGALYLTGALMMGYNLIATARKGKLMANEDVEAPALISTSEGHAGEHWHRRIERRPVQLLILSLVVVLIGGVIEMVPTFLIKENVPTIASVKPYTPLELEGRDIYIREGCVSCHSQMVRPFRHEVIRYKGEYSKSGEFVYDHPFLWGSKRTGPDLHRIGGKYPDSWHYHHMGDPDKISSGSIMPTYPWLFTNEINMEGIPAKIRGMQKLGVPYPDGFDKQAIGLASLQAQKISENLLKDDLVKYDMAEREVERIDDKEIIALIAYLQRLGTDIKVKENTKPVTQK
jgi:cytochrome c oxidase cbb3-type subunit I/II